MSQQSDRRGLAASQQNSGRFGFDPNAGGNGHPALNVLDRLADPVVTFDKQWRYTFVNARACEVLGKTRGELIGNSMWDLFPEDSNTGFREACERAWSDGKPSHDERYSKVLDAWVDTYICPTEDGALVQWLDVTGRKRIEEALRQSEARLRTLSDNLPEAAIYRFVVDPDGKPRFDFISAGIEKLTGVPASEVMKDAGVVDRTAVPEDLERMQAAIRLSAERLTPFEFEVRFRHRVTGEIRWSLLRSLPARNPDGSTSWDGIQLDITGLKRAEQSLRESEARFRSVLDDARDVVYRLNVQTGRFEYISPSAERAVGFSAEELMALDLETALAMIHPDDRSVMPAAIARLHQEGKAEAEYRQLAKSGEYRWLSNAMSLTKDGAGRPLYRNGTIRDVTGRKRNEDALRRSQGALQAFYDSAPLMMGLVEIDGDEVIAVHGNARVAALFGTTPDQLPGRSCAHINPNPAINDLWLRAYRQCLEANEPARFEYQQPHAGGIAWISAATAPVPPGESGRARCSFVAEDITGRKRAEEALRHLNQQLEQRVAERTVELAAANDKVRAERQRFLDILDTLPVVIEIIRSDHRIEWANRSCGESLGDHVGRLCYESQFRRDQPCEECQAFVPLATGRPHHWEWNLPNGHTFDIHNFPFAAEDGSPAILEMDIDITERRQAEQALKDLNATLEQRVAERTAELRESEERLRVLGDNLPDSAVYQYVHELDGSVRFVYCSAGIERLNGVKAGEVLRDAGALHGQISPEYRERLAQEELRSKRDLSDFNMEIPMRLPGGEVRWMRLQSRPRRLADGRTVWDGVQTDITEEKKAEDRLRQSQKLESIGLLAGGIAHDFNNLLTGVMGNASLLLEDAAPERAERLRSIIASTERAAHLTRQLLAYSGKGQFIVRELDVSQAVNEMADLVQFSIPKSVSLALTLEWRLPFVAMDPGQLQQILMNLIINAGEAIGDGNTGRITVTTSMADVQSPFTDDLGEELAPGRYVSIEVRDTGSGIDPEKKAKIFDPFFTTKFVGRGLGLAAIAGILRSQQGGITVESELGAGSTFRVFLPVAARPGLAIGGPAAREGRPVVLVVEDEVAVRDFISTVLRRKGYQVVQASDGQEALAVCGSAPGAIGAAIVDIIMPNMSAKDLLPALKAKQPGIRILLTSGYSEAEARRLCAAYPGAAFIQKPYGAQQIARAIDELVGVSGA